MATLYYRPLVQIGPGRPEAALPLAGGWGWFTDVEVLRRDAPPSFLPAKALPPDVAAPLTAPRSDIVGLGMNRPRLMGILNVTPDSFSDGGQDAHAADAVERGRAMLAAGTDILDIGGESTRPGAVTVPEEEEIARIVPVITDLRAAGIGAVISVDTRKAAVARAALDAGADLVNDVSALSYDPAMPGLCAERGVPVCAMHAKGTPEDMQNDPRYNDVVLDVYDALAARLQALEHAGIPRRRIIADPGIGFGKTRAHNLALLARLGIFHGLGVPLLLGASRKGFIGTIGKAPQAADRVPGSIAVALAGFAQGVQMVRVHDVAETVQARALWQASVSGCFEETNED